MRLRTLTGIALATVALSSIPAASFAAGTSATSTSTTTSSSVASPGVSSPGASSTTTRTYDLDFALPTQGKSGCLVCHGDANLVRIGPETTSTVYVDVKRLERSAHAKDTPCTGCHLDFAYTSPHRTEGASQDWRDAARLACKNCHKDEFTQYANGAHSLVGESGKDATATAERRAAEGKPAKVPLCGDCHGGHDIPSSDDVKGLEAQHRRGLKMCGQCHVREAASYDDYYHGRAYRRGSLDAPSCWDCHGFHEMLPADDSRSPVNEANLVRTCGQEGCHAEVDESFLEYAKLIHGQRKMVAANPVVAAVGRAKGAVGDAVAAVRSWF